LIFFEDRLPDLRRFTGQPWQTCNPLRFKWPEACYLQKPADDPPPCNHQQSPLHTLEYAFPPKPEYILLCAHNLL